MNFTAAAAVVTAIAGLVLGGWKLAQDAAAIRRLENLAKLRDQLPASSLARKSINEAIDWTALKVVQKERLPLPQWARFVGLALYVLGMFGAMGSLLPLLEAIDRGEFGLLTRSFNPNVVVLPILGAAASVFISMVGMILTMSNSRSRRRFLQLKQLRKLEEQETVDAHKRHQVTED